MTTKGGQEQFPGKELLYFFGQTTQLLAALHVSVWLPFKGGV